MEPFSKQPHQQQAPFDPASITRPDSSLMTYYVLVSLLTGPAFPITALTLACRYLTLRYRFDDAGVSMSWGVLFRREINLTYRRIQDIHLTRNLLQRWMGLATVAIQTASGSAGPEMSIEGILEAESLRDFLYGRMRGARSPLEESVTQGAVEGESPAPIPDGQQALVLLREIRDALRQLAEPARRSDG